MLFDSWGPGHMSQKKKVGERCLLNILVDLSSWTKFVKICPTGNALKFGRNC